MAEMASKGSGGTKAPKQHGTIAAYLQSTATPQHRSTTQARCSGVLVPCCYDAVVPECNTEPQHHHTVLLSWFGVVVRPCFAAPLLPGGGE